MAISRPQALTISVIRISMKVILTFIVLISPLASAELPTVLLVDKMAGWDGYNYQKLQVIAAKAGVKLVVDNSTKSSNPNFLDYPGLIVMSGGGGHNHKSHGYIQEAEILQLLRYVKDGGRLWLFVLPSLADFNPLLQDSFEFMVVEEKVTNANSKEVHLNGDFLSELWRGLMVGSGRAYESNLGIKGYFESLNADHEISEYTSAESGRPRTTGISGCIGLGSFMAVASFASGGGGIKYRNLGNMLTDENIENWDNEEAAERVIRWLTNQKQEYSSRIDGCPQ
jgi:hypothetical protein